ncbi:N-acetylmuramoyl-L-alanine amidase [Bacteroides reticulotermitis]|uniref:N-acetylmuramoyl-L-alanine amidase n=1 Tax=Bacteroides reticulotermitis TaxID=1133319 RepID=UPI003A853005
MRKINQIVIHCSATRADRTLTPDDLETMHRRRGFKGIGYHYYIRKDGTVHLTRPIERIGAHARGWNANSIGICYEGGLDCGGRPADTRTPEQRTSLRLLVGQLLTQFPGSRVCGHRDLSPDLNRNGEVEPEEWIKACPCFDVQAEFGTPSTT